MSVWWGEGLGAHPMMPDADFGRGAARRAGDGRGRRPCAPRRWDSPRDCGGCSGWSSRDLARCSLPWGTSISSRAGPGLQGTHKHTTPPVRLSIINWGATQAGQDRFNRSANSLNPTLQSTHWIYDFKWCLYVILIAIWFILRFYFIFWLIFEIFHFLY